MLLSEDLIDCPLSTNQERSFLMGWADPDQPVGPTGPWAHKPHRTRLFIGTFGILVRIQFRVLFYDIFEEKGSFVIL